MSNYVKATNFTTKDTLTSGDPNKIVKGTEIDSEFIAIASAVASKADLASPAFTGVPTAPTAAEFTNTAQVATSAFVQQEVNREIDALALGTMSVQNANAVAITGGSITGITDLVVADGGTGRSTLAANAVLVGNGTSGINTVAPSTTGNVLVSNGTAWTSNTIQSSGIKLGLGITGEVWSLVSKTAAVTYTNSNTYPIQVVISWATPSSVGAVNITVNGVQIFTAGTTSNSRGFSFIVPAGATYIVDVSGSANVYRWAELF